MDVTWPFDPTVYLGLIAMAGGYLLLARHRIESHTAGRSLFFFAGLLIIWLALETPLDRISDDSLQSVHMVQHVLIGFVAPPLLLLGLSSSMARALERLPGLRPLTEPVPAQLLFGTVMLVWHLPVLYDLTLSSEVVHVFEHLTFMAGGVLFWWPVISATSAGARHRMGEAMTVLYLIFGTFPQDTVAVILMFSHAPFYAHYLAVPRLVPWLDPLTDQLLAGVVLMAAGKISFAVAILRIGFAWVSRVRAEDRAAPAGTTLT